MSTLMDFEIKNKELVLESYFRLSVIEKILEIMERKEITQTELAKRMTVSKSQVSRLISDDRNLTIASIFKIFAALDEEPVLLSRSELNDLSKKQSSVRNVVHLTVAYESMPKVVGQINPLRYAGNKNAGAYKKMNSPFFKG